MLGSNDVVYSLLLLSLFSFLMLYHSYSSTLAASLRGSRKVNAVTRSPLDPAPRNPAFALAESVRAFPVETGAGDERFSKMV